MSSTRFICIAKVCNKNSGTYHFIKVKSNNLLSFKKYLETIYRDWSYFNVYAYGGIYNSIKGLQIAFYTKSNPPKTHIPELDLKLHKKIFGQI